MGLNDMIIRVCDDDDAARDGWVEAIKEALGPKTTHNVEPVAEAFAAVKELLLRQEAIRLGHHREDYYCSFDDADVLVVDYDLVFIDPQNAHHTGEELARLARIYSPCGYIIVMNQGNRTADFDLTMRGRYRSYADLNIPAKTICQPALWRTVPQGTFSPWAWDDIKAVLDGRARIAAHISAGSNMNLSVVQFTGIPASALEELSDEAFEVINPEAETQQQLADTTIVQFLHRATERKDVDAIVGCRPERAANFAAARLSKWLSRLVLGPQEVLVDVPHLLQRFPFVLDAKFGDPSDIEVWNAAIEAGAESIAEPFRTACAFARSKDWIGIDSFWWPLLEYHPAVPELRSTFDFASIPDIVFAEDISAFIPQDKATSYRAAFHNRFDRRFIARLEGPEYGPSRRLAFG